MNAAIGGTYRVSLNRLIPFAVLGNLLEIRDSQNLAKLGLGGKPSLLVL